MQTSDCVQRLELCKTALLDMPEASVILFERPDLVNILTADKMPHEGTLMNRLMVNREGGIRRHQKPHVVLERRGTCEEVLADAAQLH